MEEKSILSKFYASGKIKRNLNNFILGLYLDVGSAVVINTVRKML